MSWVVIETYENLDLWEPVAVWGAFLTRYEAERYIDSRRAEQESDWRLDLDLQELSVPE